MKNISNNQDVRIANASKIFSIIRANGESSKSQLALQSELSFPSVSKVCNALIEEGMLRTTDKTESTGGRKAACIALVPEYAFTLVIDLHHTSHGYAGLVDISGNIRCAEKFDILESDSPERILERIQQTCRNIIPDPCPKLLGVCVGVSAIISTKRRNVLQSSNSVFEGVGLESYIKTLFPSLPVIVENDANLVGLSEMTTNPVSDRLCVFFTQGIGLGITIDSQLYRGADGFAGELGHLKVTGNDRKCKCGNHGCLRTVATLESIAADLGESGLLADSETSTLYSDSLAKRYIDNDAPVVERIDLAAEKIGEALATLSDLFNPQEIVLCGNLGKLFPLIIHKVWNSCKTYSKLARSVETTIRVIQTPTHELIMRGAGECMFCHWLEDSFMVESYR